MSIIKDYAQVANTAQIPVGRLLEVVAQGAKKIIFTACHSGKLKLAFTSPDIISTSPKSFLTSRIDFTVLLLFELLKEHHLPVGQVKNRTHQPNNKIHQSRAIGHYFLCTLWRVGSLCICQTFCSHKCFRSGTTELNILFFLMLINTQHHVQVLQKRFHLNCHTTHSQAGTTY